MGCTVARPLSVLKFGPFHSDQLAKNLEPAQVELVRKTWAKIDLVETGTLVFKRLLTKYPELCKLFRKFMTLREDGSYDWDYGELQRHALLVMQALEAALDNLDDSRALAGILVELGAKHARYNVREEMFDKLWDALQYGLQEALHEKMNSDVRMAWFQVFRYISWHIIQGMQAYRRKAPK